jgi:alpha-glucoside transport system substrate-binding protein
MDFSGLTVRVFGPWLEPDRQIVESVLDYFEAATGATVDYAGSDSFEQQIVIDVGAGSPPDVAVFPQPGLAADIASKGGLVPLGEDVAGWVRENYAAGDSWVSLGTFEDQNGEPHFYGLAYKVDLKSLVWYVPENFEEAGYEIPTTLAELKELSDLIVEDGAYPWCIGLSSGAATGWPATDWVEDLMLRLNPPEVYDAWVTNEIPFDDPQVIAAIEAFGAFARNEDYVDGGSRAVAATDFRDSPNGLFSIPPKCYMHRQASFISTVFPDDVELGVDADFFYFPPDDTKDLGNPVLGAGTIWTITRDSEIAHALIDFLTTPIAHEIWMAQEGLLTPHTGVNLDAYANDTLRKQGEILQDATTFRFDGSDLMPGKIGAGSFWTGMIDYVAGASAEEVAARIQGDWDALK